MDNKILVVGATGNVGSAVVNALVAKGVTPRGLAHSDAGAQAVRDSGAEAYTGELTDLASLGPACDGMDTAFIVTRGTEDQVEMAANAIEASKEAGVRRIVRLSALVPEPADNPAKDHGSGVCRGSCCCSNRPALIARFAQVNHFQ